MNDSLTSPMLPDLFRVQQVRRETDDTFTLELRPPPGIAHPPPSRRGSSTCSTCSASARCPISISGDPAHPERSSTRRARSGR